MKIITISREFGSGGREIASCLADALNIPFYDKEIVSLIASKLSMDENYLENIEDLNMLKHTSVKFPHSLISFSSTSLNSAHILAEQAKIIKELAKKGDLVIVGRNADIILKDYHPLRIFIYADMESKIKRCRSRSNDLENLKDKEISKKIKQIDKSRRDIHDILATYPWGDMHGYDLCINTSNTNIDELIKSLIVFINNWYKE